LRRFLRLLSVPIAAGLAVAGSAANAGRTQISFADARSSIEAYRAQLPSDLRSLDAAALEAAWPAWIARRDAEIRARLAQGDEDSVVNLWEYGTSFTKWPRVTDREVVRLGSGEAVQDLLLARLDDFVAALANPGNNERLQFARDLVVRKGISLATPAGREKAEEYLVGVRERVIAENERYLRDAKSPSAYSTLFRDRGLSSDTRLTAGFAIDRAVAALTAAGRIAAGSVARVGIVGPGLDFTDKAEGYDFYPPQTIQPFALVDTLVRARMASSDLRVTTLDLSPRVNRHLEAARRRAAAGTAYVIQLPLARDQPQHEWHPDLVAYWQQFGAGIGRAVPGAPAPAIAGDVRVRAVAVRPSIVAAITPADVDIVAERTDDRFDLIVATNILVYYDAFEQSLALANISKMLRPGGLFLTNYAVAPLPPMEATASQTITVDFDRQHNGDTIYCYRRQ
jgi:SAM-dependent methyltransferase